MRPALLDVNVLIALAWDGHAFHRPARAWFHANRKYGWATCVLTESAFVRLSSQPAVVGVTIPVAEALRALEIAAKEPNHLFWPMITGLSSLSKTIAATIFGPNQVNDAILLDLAIRNQGRLATFDRRLTLTSLLLDDPLAAGSLEVIPLQSA